MQKSNIVSSRCCHPKRPTFKNSFEPLQVNQFMSIIQPKLETTNQNNQKQPPNPGQPNARQKECQEESENGNIAESLPVQKALTERDQMIKQLRINNRMITEQVQTIWEKMKQCAQSPTKRRNLFQSQDNYDKLQKDLKNAYSWIKIIQKQLQEQRNKQKLSEQIIQNLRKYRKDISDRQKMINKLKSQIYRQNRQLKQKDKLIQNKTNPDNGKKQLRLLNQQASHLYDFIEQAQKKQKEKQAMLKKQYTEVKRMEKWLVQNNVSLIQLDKIKKQCIRQIPNRNSLEGKSRVSSVRQQAQVDLQKPKIRQRYQKRSQKKLNELLLEIKVFKKKEEQFQSEYTKHQHQYKTYRLKNKELNKQISQTELQIQKLQQLSEKLRNKHLSQHRKKIRLKSLEMQKIQKQKEKAKKQHMQLLVQQHKHRKRRFKSLPHHHQLISQQKQKEEIKSTVQSSRIPNWKKCEQYGQGSSGSTKFNDKYVLEKQQQGKRISGVCVYFGPEKEFISGLSLTYEDGTRGGQYVLKENQSSENYIIQSFESSDPFIKDLFPEFTKHNGQYRLVGLTLGLSDESCRQFGQTVPFRSGLSERQYVGNIYGKMGIMAVDGRSVSVIQQLGVDVFE